MFYGSKKYLLVIVLFLLSNLALTQTKIIVDSLTGKVVDYVYIYSSDKKTSLLSNALGNFKLPNQNFTVLRFYKLGYITKNITAQYLKQFDTIKLLSKQIELNEVVVSSKKLDTIIKDKRYYLDDYIILPNSDFLIITSKINSKGFEVAYYKRDVGITYNRKFKLETEPSLFKDCFNNYHLLTKESSRQFYFTSDTSFDFLPKYTRSKFDSTLANAMLETDNAIIYRSPNKTQYLQSKNFATKINSISINFFRISNNRVTPFYHVEYNKDLMNMIKNELDDWEMLYNNKVVTKLYVNNQLMFFEKIIAKPILAPIFQRNDTIIVFNLQENTIQLLNSVGDSLKAIPIVFEKLNKLKRLTVLFDAFTKQFYVDQALNDTPYLHKLNILTGKITKEIKLEKTFVKNIQISAGKIYYLVKEKQWDDTSYLYAQNL